MRTSIAFAMPEISPARTLVDRALSAGALSTIATGGALIGLGLRDGEVSRVFRLVGRGLLDHVGVAGTPAPLTSVALGYVHHLLISALWGTLCGAVSLRPRGGGRRAFAALCCAALYAALAMTVLPPLARIGHSVTSGAVGVVPISVALLFALWGTVWLESAETQA